MRLLLLIGISSALVLPASASEKMTVSQLEGILAQHAAHLPQTAKMVKQGAPEEIGEISDGDLLQQLDQDDELLPKVAGIELTERLSTLTMYRFVGKYNLGAHVQQALEQLADRSALLRLPAAEQILRPPPDAAAQQKMLQESRSYVLRELSHLPNFMATQTTTRFDDSPMAMKYFQATADQAGLHRVGSEQRRITFRDGQEVTDEGAGPGQVKRKDNGLESRGEFGAEAAVVLMDVEKGSIAFDHWEQSMAGPAAAFRYSVPREFSHYEVTDACQDHVSFHDLPGYSGELALDPKSGAILRITLAAESKPGDPVTHVASVIEYGLVVLGNRRSICPLRSLTFMNEEANGCAHGNHKLRKPVMMVNQTIFSNYHRFGSNVTMIFDEAGNSHSSPEKPIERPPSGGEQFKPGSPAASGQIKQP
ncbi:hypothetical protein P8935_22240 [Telmatobacter sp. DSM 110680]|uniref:Uncharacterized protein n=1 Tax=Telmatobacter sp. DSM 110680 TaxID=3036704 RepID=A0AAU7DHR2_9BACT